MKKTDNPTKEFSGSEMADKMRKALDIRSKDLRSLAKVWGEKGKNYYFDPGSDPAKVCHILLDGQNGDELHPPNLIPSLK